MATDDRESLIAELDQVVEEVLTYFDGEGQSTRGRIGEWEARDVLVHFLSWHDATAWGITSASFGGPPWQSATGPDEVNRVSRALHEGEGFDEVLAQLRRSHQRLLRAARAIGDLDAPALQRANGKTLSGRQRLEGIAAHWAGHLRELREASR